MKNEVTLRLGLSGQDFSVAIGREDVRVSKQPAGLNFYQLDWPDWTTGSVHFEHGVNSFELTNVLGLMGTEDVDRLQAGVDQLDISFGLPPRNAIPHNEARLQVLALLEHLQDAGWRQNYYFSAARIKGRSTLKKSSSLDVRYAPTFEEWMSLDDAGWKLQANGVLMDISMHRDGDRMDPSQPGAYIMSMTLETEEQYMRSHFSEQDRDNWKALWPEFSKVLKKSRARKEAELRAQGLEIDADYQDPPILALQAPVITQPAFPSGRGFSRLPLSDAQ